MIIAAILVWARNAARQTRISTSPPDAPLQRRAAPAIGATLSPPRAASGQRCGADVKWQAQRGRVARLDPHGAAANTGASRAGGAAGPCRGTPPPPRHLRFAYLQTADSFTRSSTTEKHEHYQRHDADPLPASPHSPPPPPPHPPGGGLISSTFDCPPSCTPAIIMLCIDTAHRTGLGGGARLITTRHRVAGLTPVISASTALFTDHEPRSRHS